MVIYKAVMLMCCIMLYNVHVCIYAVYYKIKNKDMAYREKDGPER